MLQKYLQQEFANEFIRKAQPEQEHRRLNPEAVQNLTTRQAKEENFFDLTGLFEVLSVICGTSEKHLILMIDKADQASNNQVFLDFLGQLREYYLNREDPPTNMDIPVMAEKLYEVTGGYPYLVSCLCKKLDESDSKWIQAELRAAVRDLLKESNTLFEDVIKNLQNNPSFSKLAEMLNYFTSVQATDRITNSEYLDRSQYIRQGKLDMEMVLHRGHDIYETIIECS